MKDPGHEDAVTRGHGDAEEIPTGRLSDLAKEQGLGFGTQNAGEDQKLIYRRVRRVTQGKFGTWNLEHGTPAPGRRHCEAKLMPKQSRVDWHAGRSTQEKIKSGLMLSHRRTQRRSKSASRKDAKFGKKI